MIATRKRTGLAIFATLFLSFGNVGRAQAQAAAAEGQDAGKQQYTMPEYNAEQAAAQEKNPAQQIKLLDDFVSKYPNSTLLKYVYPLYYQAYGQLKNYKKVIEYADKMAAMGDKIDAPSRYAALSAHAGAYSAMITDPATAPAAVKDTELAKGSQEAAVAGLKALEEVKKPENVTDEAFATQKKQVQVFLNGIAGQAAAVQKNYPDAINYFKAVLALTPDDAITSYRLGQVYLATTPPQQMDAFWAVARAVTSKGATQQQATQLKTYLRKLILNYQQAACDSLTDAELNELLQLAGSSADRPASYTLPNATDLEAARKDMTIASVITDLKAGGDKAKVTWLASCGLEFPDVPGKVIEVAGGSDAVQLKVAFVTSDAEFEAATIANMDVKVVGQADAARVEKGSAIHFTGTLASYDPDPAFMVHWDKGKVKEEDIPKDKGAKKPAAKKPVTRRPAVHKKPA